MRDQYSIPLGSLSPTMNSVTKPCVTNIAGLARVCLFLTGCRCTFRRNIEGIAHGMTHLGNMHLIHRDLAARNVLVGDGVCKVADFGLSHIVQSNAVPDENSVSAQPRQKRGSVLSDVSSADDVYQSTGGAIAVRWTAPESMETRIFTHASDMWSYGIVMVELLTDVRCSFSYRVYLTKDVIGAHTC
jgi:serine/threonine protein kinase